MQFLPRSILTSAVDLLLRSGVFVALCAVALAWETTLLASTAPRSLPFYGFVFCATWASYRLHAVVARWRGGLAIPRGDLMSTLLALIGAVAFLPSVAMREWPVIGLSALLALAYSLPALPGRRALREFGLLKIATLAGVWTLITAYLPAAGADASMVAYLCARRFSFMFALCVAFDVRDADADARVGIRTVAVLLGQRGSYVLMRATLLAFAGLVLIAPLFAEPFGRTTIALLASAILTWIAIEAARRFATHRFYLGCIDGMMLVQCLLIVIVRHV